MFIGNIFSSLSSVILLHCTLVVGTFDTRLGFAPWGLGYLNTLRKIVVLAKYWKSKHVLSSASSQYLIKTTIFSKPYPSTLSCLKRNIKVRITIMFTLLYVKCTYKIIMYILSANVQFNTQRQPSSFGT